MLIGTRWKDGEDDDQGELRGFDELRNNGMNRAEVAAIRSYFSADVQEVRKIDETVTVSWFATTWSPV